LGADRHDRVNVGFALGEVGILEDVGGEIDGHGWYSCGLFDIQGFMVGFIYRSVYTIANATVMLSFPPLAFA
jgi:hypothetical protein